MIKNYEPYLMGETAFHHQGDIGYLKNLIEAAAELKLDAIKFHLLFDVNDYFVSTHPALDTIKQWVFSKEEWDDLIKYASERELDVIALCNDVASLDWITEECETKVKGVEIHATGINDIFLLNAASKFPETVILGVGGSTLEEIQFAIETLKDNNKSDIFLMYGFQNYPTDYQDINFSKISVIKKIFDLPVGYADHTDPADPNNEFITASAILKGINVIEKHFTLDVKEKRIDSQAAVSIDQIKKIKKLNEIMFLANGRGGIEMSAAEKKYGDTGPMKKAIVARKKIMKGEKLKLEDLAYKRTPGSSYLDQNSLTSLVGLTAIEEIEKDELISYSKVQYEFKLAETAQFFTNK